MPTAVELGDFLVRLQRRRANLARLTSDGASPQVAELLEEVSELEEELVVADAELRAQQAQLEESEMAIAALVDRNDALFEVSGMAVIRTDASGVIIEANRAARVLVPPPPIPSARRLLTLKFSQFDRSRVRKLINSAHRNPGETQQDGPLSLIATDPATPVMVSVTGSLGGPGRELTWSLTPVRQQRPGELRLVPTPDAASTVESATASTERLDRVLEQLAGAMNDVSMDDQLAAVLRAAADALPIAGACAVTVRRRGRLETARATSDSIADLDRLQSGGLLGPVADACNGRVGRILDTQGESRWPLFGERAGGSGFRSVLSVPLTVMRWGAAALTWYADAPGGFDAAAERIGRIVAGQAGPVLSCGQLRRNFDAAVESRQQVGTAVGLLVERYRWSADHAFHELITASQQHNVKLRELARTVADTGLDPRHAADLG